MKCSVRAKCSRAFQPNVLSSSLLGMLPIAALAMSGCATAPVAPAAPSAPVTPAGPAAPVAPSGPVAPVGPVDPLHAASSDMTSSPQTPKQRQTWSQRMAQE